MKRSAIRRDVQKALAWRRRAKRLRPRSVKRIKRDREYTAMRAALQERDPICGYPDCNQPTKDGHHILPVARGGKDKMGNLVGLCRLHHIWVHGHPLQATEMGLLRSPKGTMGLFVYFVLVSTAVGLGVAFAVSCRSGAQQGGRVVQPTTQAVALSGERGDGLDLPAVQPSGWAVDVPADNLAVSNEELSVSLRGEGQSAGTPTIEVLELAVEVEPQRYYNTAALIEILSDTPWPVHLWPTLFQIMACESPAEDGVDALAVGDTQFLLTGPSLGLVQINIAEWPHLARSYDLLDPRENLKAAWSLYLEAGREFTPWSCAP